MGRWGEGGTHTARLCRYPWSVPSSCLRTKAVFLLVLFSPLEPSSTVQSCYRDRQPGCASRRLGSVIQPMGGCASDHLFFTWSPSRDSYRSMIGCIWGVTMYVHTNCFRSYVTWHTDVEKLLEVCRVGTRERATECARLGSTAIGDPAACRFHLAASSCGLQLVVGTADASTERAGYTTVGRTPRSAAHRPSSPSRALPISVAVAITSSFGLLFLLARNGAAL